MILIVHTSTPGDHIVEHLGRPEYSYRFVLREFRPLLDELGTVIEVDDPSTEVPPIYSDSRSRGEDCIFLCFLPPNKVPFHLACPTIPVFAWEYETLPNEAFSGKPRNDWIRVLHKLGAALTHSSYIVERTRAVLGPDFPIQSVPAPLWDRMQLVNRRPSDGVVRLAAGSVVVDSLRTDLSAYSKERMLAALPEVPPLPVHSGDHQGRLELTGVVYAAIFNPGDSRKNTLELISAFCAALHDKSDAVLVLKLTHYDAAKTIPQMLEYIYKMDAPRCRVVFVHAYLDEPNYHALLQASTYAVNASHGEGQCLPLMEYMSAGKPAIAPRHTSMRDYLDEDCAFLVDSSAEPGAWPHDQRQLFRTLRQRIHFHSLVSAYRRSYHVARHEPATYAAMSAAAVRALRSYCSIDVVGPRLNAFLQARLAIPHQLDVAGTATTAN